MTIDLKPCPFCGGEAERIDIGDGENAGGSCVSCTVCQASSNVEFEFKENFISNWNRRAPAEARAVYPEWRPIETAPKDFTPIIGLTPRGIRQWFRWVNDRHCGTGWFNSEQQRVDPTQQPTQWHPLPPLPLNDEAE